MYSMQVSSRKRICLHFSVLTFISMTFLMSFSSCYVVDITMAIKTCLIGTVSVLFEYQLVIMEQEGKSHFLFPLRSCDSANRGVSRLIRIARTVTHGELF